MPWDVSLFHWSGLYPALWKGEGVRIFEQVGEFFKPYPLLLNHNHFIDIEMDEWILMEDKKS